jgi:hypothetical protein
VKNFLVAELAKKTKGSSLNLIADSDTLKEAALRFPVRTDDGLAVEERAFIGAGRDRAYEEIPASEPEDLDGVARAVDRAAGGGGEAPQFISTLARLSDEARNLGELMTLGRLEIERSVGLANLELPTSRLEATRCFRLFLVHVLSNLAEFVECHNRVLGEFRRRQHQHDPTRPVPDLQPDEAPFWIWRSGEPREPLRLIAEGGRMGLVAGFRPVAWIAPKLEPEQFAAEIEALEREGTKIRTRALTTTMYARLFVADLFLHGIGGAFYDRVTDEITREFFGLDPPAFAVASATVHLDIDDDGDGANGVAEAEARARKIFWNPERFIRPDAADEDLRALIRLKGALVAENERLKALGPSRASAERRGRRREIFEEIHRVLARLRPAVEPLIEAERERAEALREAERAREIATDREYPFILHPASKLAEFYRRAAADAAGWEFG